MPEFELKVSCKVPFSSRARQLEGMFDVPAREKLEQHWSVKIPIEGLDWRVGLIVGPSGSGKSQIARRMYGKDFDAPLSWPKGPVIDAFDKRLSMETIAAACGAVGFNTIPSWMKPYAVLSNGEKFRVELARRLVEGKPGVPVVVDEFTSLVDRQVAKIAAHAVRKFVERSQPAMQFVGVTCHYDVIEWLRPDWIYDPSKRRFARGSLQRRPALECVVGPVPHAAWEQFAPYHYLTATLHRNAVCWGLWLEGVLVGFAGMLWRPLNRRGRRVEGRLGIVGISRCVVLPDYQGLGLAFVLMEAVASIYKGAGYAVNMYPAHPTFTRAFDRSKRWAMTRRPGVMTPKAGESSAMRYTARPCATFRYVGDAMEHGQAAGLIEEAKRLKRDAAAVAG